MIGLVVFWGIFMAATIALWFFVRQSFHRQDFLPHSIGDKCIIFFTWLLTDAMAVLVLVILFGATCIPVNYETTIHNYQEIVTAIEEYDKGNTLSNDEKIDLLQKIKEYNKDASYLKEHYDSKWNGAFISDEAENIEEINISEILKKLADA